MTHKNKRNKLKLKRWNKILNSEHHTDKAMIEVYDICTDVINDIFGFYVSKAFL